MGVEYRHFVVPRARGFRPAPEALARFVEDLDRGFWIPPDAGPRVRAPGRPDETLSRNPDEAWFAGRASADLILSWDVEDLEADGVRNHLASGAPEDEELYADVQLHLATDYVLRTSDVVEPFASTRCPCGAELEYEVPAHDSRGDPFYSPRLRRTCPCGRGFDPSELEVTVHDPWTGEPSRLRGGLAYRFALVIDRGKCLPEPPVTLAPELASLLRGRFGTSFCEVGEGY